MIAKTFARMQQIDFWFLIFLVTLVGLGLMILHTASISLNDSATSKELPAFFKQLYIGIIPGILLFFIVQALPYRIWKPGGCVIYGLAFILNLLVLHPALGLSDGGATRWLGFELFSFQPSELFKLGLILCLSFVLAKRKDNINSPASVIRFLLLIGIPVGIVALVQSNMSTAALIAGIGGSLLLVSRLHLLWLGSFVLFVLLAGGVGMALQDYRMERVTEHAQLVTGDQVQTCAENTQQYWHLCQNLIAVGSGGITGVGLGEGVQKFNYVPKSANDSIFAIYAEEMGLVGVTFFFLLMLGIVYRGLVIAGKQRDDDFARLVVLGIIAWLVLQMFINVGSTVGLLPVTGITLPFVSQGNTSLWVLFIAVGIIASISKSSRA